MTFGPPFFMFFLFFFRNAEKLKIVLSPTRGSLFHGFASPKTSHFSTIFQSFFHVFSGTPPGSTFSRFYVDFWPKMKIFEPFFICFILFTHTHIYIYIYITLFFKKCVFFTFFIFKNRPPAMIPSSVLKKIEQQIDTEFSLLSIHTKISKIRSIDQKC